MLNASCGGHFNRLQLPQTDQFQVKNNSIRPFIQFASPLFSGNHKEGKLRTKQRPGTTSQPLHGSPKLCFLLPPLKMKTANKNLNRINTHANNRNNKCVLRSGVRGHRPTPLLGLKEQHQWPSVARRNGRGAEVDAHVAWEALKDLEVFGESVDPPQSNIQRVPEQITAKKKKNKNAGGGGGRTTLRKECNCLCLQPEMSRY